MQKYLLILMIALIIPIPAFTQPDTLWTKTYEGNGYCIRKTFDGGYIISGRTMNLGNTDALLVKIDVLGVVEWTQTYGGGDDDIANDVIQTVDGGFILTGYTCSISDVMEVYVVKTDSLGNEEWSGTYGDEYSSDIGYGIDQTPDGGYVITGVISIYTGFIWDVFFMKIDSSGNEIWSNSWDGAVYDVEVTSDGGCIMVGHTSAMGYFDIYVKLIKTDTAGNLEWEHTFGDTSSCAAGFSVQQTADGGYIITGYATESYTSYCGNVYLLKVNVSGDEEWSKIYGGIYSDEGRCVQQTVDGGYIITGYTILPGAENSDVYLIKTDQLGNEIWSQTYGGDGSDYGMSVRQTEDEGYIVAGSTYSFGPQSIYVIRLGRDNSIDPTYLKQPSEFILYPPYPNPFNQSAVISYKLQAASFVNLTIYDIAGREVARLVDGFQTAGSHSITFDGLDLASGIYFARLEAGEFKQTKKLLLLK